jgi:hypothetical protein
MVHASLGFQAGAVLVTISTPALSVTVAVEWPAASLQAAATMAKNSGNKREGPAMRTPVWGKSRMYG